MGKATQHKKIPNMIQPETEPADRSKESRDGDQRSAADDIKDYAWKPAQNLAASLNPSETKRDPFIGSQHQRESIPNYDKEYLQHRQ